jgi:hypothetical protein
MVHAGTKLIWYILCFFFVQAFDLFSYEVMTPLANISCARLQLPNNINGLLAASYEFDNWVSMTKGFITLSYWYFFNCSA